MPIIPEVCFCQSPWQHSGAYMVCFQLLKLALRPETRWASWWPWGVLTGDRHCRAPCGGSARGSPGHNGGSWDRWVLQHHLSVPKGLFGSNDANSAFKNIHEIFLHCIVACLCNPMDGCWLKMEEEEGILCLGACWQPALRARTCLT